MCVCVCVCVCLDVCTLTLTHSLTHTHRLFLSPPPSLSHPPDVSRSRARALSYTPTQPPTGLTWGEARRYATSHEMLLEDALQDIVDSRGVCGGRGLLSFGSTVCDTLMRTKTQTRFMCSALRTEENTFHWKRTNFIRDHIHMVP